MQLHTFVVYPVGGGEPVVVAIQWIHAIVSQWIVFGPKAWVDSVDKYSVDAK